MFVKDFGDLGYLYNNIHSLQGYSVDLLPQTDALIVWTAYALPVFVNDPDLISNYDDIFLCDLAYVVFRVLVNNYFLVHAVGNYEEVLVTDDLDDVTDNTFYDLDRRDRRILVVDTSTVYNLIFKDAYVASN